MLRYSSIILCACAWVTTAHAQAPRIDSTEVGTLGLTVDALAFFKDNEYDGDVVKGYSLPGFRFTPRLTYTPLREVRLEAGLHATVLEGANKYPSYVFHDIAHWKGNQYQHGAHALPFFRAVTQLGGPTAEHPEGRPSRTTIVLGDIYGGLNHGLSLPLYNPELTLTDDPEMGAQVLVERRRWYSDIWINWQSYIYEEDTHQEAFTVGWSQHIALGTQSHTSCADKAASIGCTGESTGWGIPLQVVVQHRGGEQDAADLDLGVQTIANGAVGIDYTWRPQPTKADGSRRILSSVRGEALALGCMQQSGKLWPFDNGAAFWASGEVTLKRDLRLKAGILHAPRQFCTLYGSPFFGTLSMKREAGVFRSTTSGYWAVEYSRTFGGAYTIAAKADGYIVASGHLSPRNDATVETPYDKTARLTTPFSFGLYFRACPSCAFNVKM